MTMTELTTLLDSTTGASKPLDKALSDTLKVPLRDYSSSVDACLELIHERLPKAHWHVGRAEDGVSVFATLVEGDHREEAMRVTVPLALLTVLMKFLDC